MSYNEIISKFIREFPELYNQMNDISHNVVCHNECVNVNPYHGEGSIWAHTMMVCQEAKKFADEDVFFAALCHDLGKIKAAKLNIKDDRQYMSFIGHEGFSFYMTIDVLKKFNLPTHRILRIAEMVARHSEFYEWKGATSNITGEDIGIRFRNDRTLYHYLKLLVECDVRGRVSDNNSTAFIESLPEMENVDELWGRLGDKHLFIMVGPPGCGKSTFIDDAERKNATVISRDEILMELADTSDYNEAWNSVDQKEVDRIYNIRLNEALRGDKDIFIDMTNMTRKRRRGLTRQANQHGFKTCAVVMCTGYNDILRFNSKREGKALDSSVIDNMIQRFTFPVAGVDVDDVILIDNFGGEF